MLSKNLSIVINQTNLYSKILSACNCFSDHKYQKKYTRKTQKDTELWYVLEIKYMTAMQDFDV